MKKPLTEFEQLVLLSLARLGEDAYGMAVQSEIEHRVGRRASLAAVYATLGRMEERGFVNASVSAPTARRGGRATKYFRLKPSGARALDEARAVMDRMWDGVVLSREVAK
jgi:PadR family transcriptional regulator PadR